MLAWSSHHRQGWCQDCEGELLGAAEGTKSFGNEAGAPVRQLAAELFCAPKAHGADFGRICSATDSTPDVLALSSTCDWVTKCQR